MTSTNSEKPFKLAIPKRVKEAAEKLIPQGITGDFMKSLEDLRDDPYQGTKAEVDGSRYFHFPVFRNPVVFRLVVKYAILEEQRIILVARIALDDEDQQND